LKALIVAAGISSRLYPLTRELPKCLLEVGGKSIIRRSMDILRERGVKDICVVVGFKKEKIIKHLGDEVSYKFNPFYRMTNDMVSLWFGEDFVGEEEFLYLHSDLVYEPEILDKCLEADGDILLVIDKKACDEEDMKVRVEDGIVVESSKDIPLEEAYGEWIGIAKFSPYGGKKLFEEIEDILYEEENFNLYDTYAFTKMARKGIPIYPVLTEGRRWIEIDFIKELELARSWWKDPESER